MTKDNQQWDAMTNQQKIEWLAKHVMQWETRYEKDCYDCDYLQVLWPDSVPFYASGKGKGWVGTHGFNPLIDWNDWRKVEEKVMEDHKLFHSVVIQFDACNSCSFNDGALDYMQADLPTRCKAVFLALQ